MPSTWTDNLGLEKPATGEQAGVWGGTVNNSFDFLDTGIDGNVSIPMSASSYDLLTNPGAASIGRNKVLVFTGAISQEGTVRIKPDSARKIYFVTNKTSGGFALNFTQGSGPTFKLLNGYAAIIYAQGGTTPGVFGALSDPSGTPTGLQVNSLLVQANLIVQGQVQWQTAAIFNQPSTFQGLATFSAGAVIQAPLAINLGSDAFYDLYYRGTDGNVARLAVGTPGQALSAGGPSGLQWVSVNASLNMPILNSSPHGIFFASPTATMVQDPQLVYYAGAGLGIGMVPGRGLCIGGGVFPGIQLDNTSVPPAGRTILITTSGLSRWSFGASGDAEDAAAKGTTGSNFILGSWNNDNSAAFTNFASYRTGRSTFGIYNDGYNAQVAVVNRVASQDALVVRGANSQTGYLQQWQNSAGTTVASIDVGGSLFLANNNFLTLNNNKRLEIGIPSAVGHPLGTLHIGADQGSGPNCIVFEKSATQNVLNVANVCRLFYYGTGFSIQYQISGQTWYANLAFTVGAGPAQWNISNSPLF